MPLVRTWVSGRGGHLDCDGTCREFEVARELLDYFHDAGRRVAVGDGLPDPGPLKPPRCPQTGRQRREFERLLAEAKVAQRETELRAGVGPAGAR
jgi:hypothetical protein